MTHWKTHNENIWTNDSVFHCRRLCNDGMDSQDIQPNNGEQLMNYKKLFWGYVTFNFICGIVVGGYKAIQQGQVKERLSSPRKFQSKEMQDIVNHYNKETISAN
ncbi:hypothetical protein UFOVP784_37 [uncultured Caudovirales phage]|uniref:Uncharacterized protein n=1 Tax=uncultured Caudovirales phage TaxID=2100421 RepID=A0A6J5P4D4_9CAUD|nr:hypothetical protein UFOVP436_37 [uncultured Caudovirales phage]CAB4162374.1 hypothetical protein UFOVP784_37 [uncultured Caudovirales phage]